MSDNEAWFDEIAQATGVDADEVTQVLEAHRVPHKRLLPGRRRLRVNAVHFAGVKNRRSNDGDDQRVPEAFSFTQTLDQAVTAFVTRRKNDAGKSSVLEVILWAVRGTTRLAPDVQAWMHHALVEIAVDDERFLVAWKIEKKVPAGQLIQLAPDYRIDWAQLDGAARTQMLAEADGAPEQESAFQLAVDYALDRGVTINSFDNADSFKAAIAEFMSDRLRFETAEVFTKNKHALDDGDGQVVGHGWPLWSQALTISEKEIKVTIGEDAQSSTRVLEMYLGTAWGPTAMTAKARKKALESDVLTLRRRQATEDTQRQSVLAALEAELAALEEEREQLPVLDDVEQFDELIAAMQRTTGRVADAEGRYGAALGQKLQLARQLEVALADEVALAEAAITRRFWHSLKPSCCPRCDTVVDESRWAREQGGQCSLCDSDLESESAMTMVAEEDAATEDDDSHDELSLARSRIIALELDVILAEEELRAAEAVRTVAVTDQRAAREAIEVQPFDPGRRRELERRIAVLTGRIEERGQISVRSEDLAAREQVIAILDAAEKYAKKRSDAERTIVLGRVSEDIATLGRQLGFTELDKATFQANGNLPVVKGGEDANFGKLTEGEKMRLKIAVIISLLRVGTAAGIGRHPGLLVIDSIAREEMNPADVRQLLTLLQAVAEETGLQVIASSANGELVADVLPAGAVRMARESDDYMW